MITIMESGHVWGLGITFEECFEWEGEEAEEEEGRVPFNSIVELDWDESEMGIKEEVWVDWIDDFGGKYFG